MIVLHKGQKTEPFRTIKTSLGIVNPNTNEQIAIDPEGMQVPAPQGPFILPDESGTVEPVTGWYWDDDNFNYANSIIYNGHYQEMTRAEDIGRVIGKAAEWVLKNQDDAFRLYQKIKGVPPPALPAPVVKPSKDNTTTIIAIVGAGLLAALYLMR